MVRDRHSVLLAQSSRISRRQMYRKVGKYKTTAEGKKSIGCHGQKERMEEISSLDKLTLCKILPWFTFVSV